MPADQNMQEYELKLQHSWTTAQSSDLIPYSELNTRSKTYKTPNIQSFYYIT